VPWVVPWVVPLDRALGRALGRIKGIYPPLLSYLLLYQINFFQGPDVYAVTIAISFVKQFSSRFSGGAASKADWYVWLFV